jgi:hypothetical protein
MAATTKDRYGERQPSELVPYTGASGYTYYKDTFVMVGASGAMVLPLVQGSGASNAKFIGVASNNVNLSGGLGASQAILNVWKTGEFTFVSQGTGASSHIGRMGYGLDNQTVGTSAAAPAIPVGEIVGIPSTSSYRVRIDNAVALPFSAWGVSWESGQN